MDENSVERPLLLSRSTERVKKTPLFVSWAKWILKFVIWVIFLAWVALIFFIPAQFVNEAFEKWAQLTSGTVFGITGWYLLLTCYSTFVSPHPPHPNHTILICLVGSGVVKTAGSFFLVFSGPVLIIAFLSIAYLLISGEEELHEYVFYIVERVLMFSFFYANLRIKSFPSISVC